MIVLLHGARAFGAVEAYVVDLLDGLRLRGDDATLVHVDDPVLEPFAALGGGCVSVEILPSELVLGGGVRSLATLYRTLRRLRPDVVHLVDVWPVAAVAARLARVPRILVTHHTPELRRRDSIAGRLWWRLGWSVRPEVVYTSAADRDRDGRASLRSHVVSLGIDLERFRGADRALPVGGPVVGSVGRLETQKAPHVLIDAIPLVLERHPDARFVLVGDGSLRHSLEDRAHDLGVETSVLFAGHRDDVPRWLASFDVFVLTSLFEGLCYAVLEAQAAGVPVVATPVGGVRETVVAGETGLVVATEDVRALADAVSALLDDPAEAQRLAREAESRVARFSRERMVTETLALYGAPHDDE
jgi:glycosyltransferase involved in cell wall biosynthesis